MSKTTMNNFKATLEQLKDELSEEELKKVSGGKPGKVIHQDLQCQKFLDKASVILF